MNIYFLLEGRSTEKKVYKSWLTHLLPELSRVNFHDQVEHNNYYLISANGYPRIIDDGIPNAVDKINEIGRYNYFVISLDADEDSVNDREKEVSEFLKNNNLSLGNTKLFTIVQNRCIETWFLGNNKMFNSRQPMTSPLLDYARYYDVSVDDPELMGNYNEEYNHAGFHHAYLEEIFLAKNRKYTKKMPRDAQEPYYLEQLIARVKSQPEHLKSFQKFIEFCKIVRQELA